MSNKGKFIVIEGIDSSGKGTQMNLLKKRLINAGCKVLTQDFPRYYSSVWGKIVGEFLIGKYGKLDKVDPHLAVFPYMIDQYTWCRDVGKSWLEGGGIILLDRYFTSNVHQVAKLKTTAKKKYRDWMWPLGYESLGILIPDIVFFLDVNPNYTKKLIKLKRKREYLKGRNKDLAEKNWEHQWRAYKEYIFMTKNKRNWKRIECITNNSLDSPKEINERIWKEVKLILRKNWPLLKLPDN